MEKHPVIIPLFDMIENSTHYMKELLTFDDFQLVIANVEDKIPKEVHTYPQFSMVVSGLANFSVNVPILFRIGKREKERIGNIGIPKEMSVLIPKDTEHIFEVENIGENLRMFSIYGGPVHEKRFVKDKRNPDEPPEEKKGESTVKPVIFPSFYWGQRTGTSKGKLFNSTNDFYSIDEIKKGTK